MNLEQLEVIDLVVRIGSFNGAAKALKKSQPAISIAVRGLEEELNFPLFDRSEYRPKLTEQGKVFYASVQETIQSYNRTKTIGNELSSLNNETTIRITRDPLVAFSCLEPIFKICTSLGVLNRLVIKECVEEGGMNDLVDGHATFVFADLPAPSPDLEWIPVQSVEMLPAVSTNIKKTYKSSTEILKNLPQVITYNQTSVGNDLQNLPSSLNSSRLNVFVSDHAMKLNMIRSGLAWGKLPMDQIENEGLTVLSKNIMPEHHIKLCFIRNKNKPLGKISEQIWNAMKLEIKKDLSEN